MTILVSAGSKHGATAEIADRIGDILKSRGLEVAVTEPRAVSELERYQAIILGSAVYMGQWRDDAKDLASRVGALAAPPPVWLFSSGPIGDPPKPDEPSVDVTKVSDLTSALKHVVFPGKVDRSRLGFGEKAVMIALRAPEGDFRDWGQVADWAHSIADDLGAKPPAY